MNTVLVTGANGQLGSSIRNQAGLHTSFRFLFTDIDTLDICDKESVVDYIRQNEVDYILNCAAFTAVDRAEDEKQKCALINYTAVTNLAEAAKSVNAKILHISTDYVFDGNSCMPYKEDDAVNPTSVYGKTKLDGERMLMSVCPDSAVIIRTSWLYSEYGNNFLKTMLRLGMEHSSISVVFDQIGTPTYAGDLATAMLSILDQSRKGIFIPGIYHYSNEGVCSWYDFALTIMELANLQTNVLPIESADYLSKAVRPHYSVLNKGKIKQVYSVSVPYWLHSLRICMERLLKTEQ